MVSFSRSHPDKKIDNSPRSQVERESLRVLRRIHFNIIEARYAGNPDLVERGKEFIGEKPVKIGRPARIESCIYAITAYRHEYVFCFLMGPGKSLFDDGINPFFRISFIVNILAPMLFAYSYCAGEFLGPRMPT